jgi:hypothetical protein
MAARGYFAYGVVYYVGGLSLLSQGVGVMGSTGGRRGSTLLFWALVGLVPLLGVPYLLRAPRRWFERWVLSRRDFARVVAVFLAFRAWKVGQIAVHDSGASVTAPWGGTVSFQTGAAIFLILTVAALAATARAAWGTQE